MYNICITIEQDLATLVGTLNLHKLHKIVPRRLYIRPFDSYQLELPMMNPNPILPSVGLEGRRGPAGRTGDEPSSQTPRDLGFHVGHL